MAKSQTKKFESSTGYPVTVYATDASGSSRPVRVDGTYETSDPDELAALAGSPEVTEVKSTSKGKN